MNEARADLHIHTHYSDSTDSPALVVSQAVAAGLKAIAIADHDTADGISEAVAAALPSGLEIISGVELSSELARKDIHILGYGFDLKDNPLLRSLKGMQEARMERMRKMVAKLNSLGFKDITYEDVAGRLRSDAVGRLHLAQLLVEKKVVPSLDMAFARYLGEGAAAYFPKFKQTPQEAIRLIKESGGVAVMAHPMLTQKDELIPELVRAGLDGLEAFYPNCSMEICNFYVGLAKKHKLLVTGGSDAHGKSKKNTQVGKAYVSYNKIIELKERIKSSH